MGWVNSERVEVREHLKGPRFDEPRLVREMVAFANSSGGYLIIGASPDGSVPGVSPEDRKKLTHKWIAELVESYIGPYQSITFSVNYPVVNNEEVVRITVEPHPEPPVMLEKQGRYKTDSHVGAWFERGAIPVRYGHETLQADAKDMQYWLKKAKRKAINERR